MEFDNISIISVLTTGGGLSRYRDVTLFRGNFHMKRVELSVSVLQICAQFWNATS